jgi:hypothetical protein
MADGPQRNLRVVQFINEGTGEVVGQHAEDPLTGELEALKEQLADANRIIVGLERDVKAAIIREQKAREDKAAEARGHYLWPLIAIVYTGWQHHCNHKGAAFTSGRFWAAEPYFRSTTYGKTLELRVRRVAQAIAGAAFNPYTTRARNGRLMRYDDWEQNVFGSNGKFERFCKLAPLDFEPVLSPRLLDAIRVAEGRARSQAQRKASERATG